MSVNAGVNPLAPVPEDTMLPGPERRHPHTLPVIATINSTPGAGRGVEQSARSGNLQRLPNRGSYFNPRSVTHRIPLMSYARAGAL